MISRALPFALILSVLSTEAIAQDSVKPYFVCGPAHPAEKGPCATPPRGKSTPDPKYSEEARKNGVQGTVVVRVTVGADGVPRDVIVVRGLGYGLNDEAVAAVKSWRFEPGTIDEKPVPVLINVEVNFRLTDGPVPPPRPGPIALQDAAKLYSRALDAEGSDDCGTAISLLAQVTKIDPQHWAAWNLLGLCYVRLDDDAAAETAFKKQIEVSPQTPYAYNNLGRVYLRRRDYDKALVEFRRQLEIVPQDRYSLLNIATTLRDQKKFKDAITAFNAVEQVTPNNVAIYIGLLDCYLRLEMQDEAMKALDKAASLTSSGSGWNTLAWILARHNVQLERAERYARVAISTESASLMSVTLDPLSHGVYAHINSLASAWDTMGWIRFLRGDTASAEKYLTPAWIVLQHPTISDHLAQLYEKLGKKDQALSYSGLTVAAAQKMDHPQDSDLEATENARARIDRLAPAGSVKHLLETTAQQYANENTLAIPNQGGQNEKAGFAILQAQDSKPSQVRLITGDTALQSMAATVAAKVPRVPVPEDEGIDIVRWATLTCARADADCALTIANARDAVHGQLESEFKVAPPVTTDDPYRYSSETLGISLTLPEGWSKRNEAAATASTPASVVFSKEDSLCWLMLMRVHLEATEDTFNKLFESMLKDGTNFKQLSQSSVSRDGLKGVRTSFNFEENGVEMHAVVENFSEGDVHYQIAAGAPKDQFERYTAELESSLASIQFTNSHVSPKDVKP
jgi:TonB family protein